MPFRNKDQYQYALDSYGNYGITGTFGGKVDNNQEVTNSVLPIHQIVIIVKPRSNSLHPWKQRLCPRFWTGVEFWLEPSAVLLFQPRLLFCRDVRSDLWGQNPVSLLYEVPPACT